MLVFLELNGVDFIEDQDQIADMFERLAAGEASQDEFFASSPRSAGAAMVFPLNSLVPPKAQFPPSVRATATTAAIRSRVFPGSKCRPCSSHCAYALVA